MKCLEQKTCNTNDYGVFVFFGGVSVEPEGPEPTPENPWIWGFSGVMEFMLTE